MLDNSKWSYNRFIKLLKIYKLNNFEDKLKYFKNKKVALIGTSPINLIAANIYALFGAKISIFEKKKARGRSTASTSIHTRAYTTTNATILDERIRIKGTAHYIDSVDEHNLA